MVSIDTIKNLFSKPATNTGTELQTTTENKPASDTTTQKVTTLDPVQKAMNCLKNSGNGEESHVKKFYASTGIISIIVQRLLCNMSFGQVGTLAKAFKADKKLTAAKAEFRTALQDMTTAVAKKALTPNEVPGIVGTTSNLAEGQNEALCNAERFTVASDNFNKAFRKVVVATGDTSVDNLGIFMKAARLMIVEDFKAQEAKLGIPQVKCDVMLRTFTEAAYQDAVKSLALDTPVEKLTKESFSSDIKKMADLFMHERKPIVADFFKNLTDARRTDFLNAADALVDPDSIQEKADEEFKKIQADYEVVIKELKKLRENEKGEDSKGQIHEAHIALHGYKTKGRALVEGKTTVENKVIIQDKDGKDQTVDGKVLSNGEVEVFGKIQMLDVAEKALRKIANSCDGKNRKGLRKLDLSNETLSKKHAEFLQADKEYKSAKKALKALKDEEAKLAKQCEELENKSAKATETPKSLNTIIEKKAQEDAAFLKNLAKMDSRAFEDVNTAVREAIQAQTKAENAAKEKARTEAMTAELAARADARAQAKASKAAASESNT